MTPAHPTRSVLPHSSGIQINLSMSITQDWLKGRQTAKACRMNWKALSGCSGSPERGWNLAVCEHFCPCMCVCVFFRDLGNRFRSRRQYVWSLWHHGLIRRSWEGQWLDKQTGVWSSSIDTCSPDFIESGAAAHSLKLHVILLEPQNENYCGKNMFIVIQMQLCLCIGI